MGSLIEINDTLKISKERGFPKSLTLDSHISYPSSSAKFIGQEFNFWNKGERLYHISPTRVFLVEEIDGKWLYWGNALIISQIIGDGKTEGVYKIVKIYHPDFQKQMTIEESPKDRSYFPNNPTSFS
mgnify:CR=1 FL=1